MKYRIISIETTARKPLWGICVEYYIFCDSLERIKQGGRIDTRREKWNNPTLWWKTAGSKSVLPWTWRRREIGDRVSMLRTVDRCHSGEFLIDSAAKKHDWLPRGLLLPADMPELCGHTCQEDLIISPIIAEETLISANILHGRPEDKCPDWQGTVSKFMCERCRSQPILPNPNKRNSSINRKRSAPWLDNVKCA